MIKMWVVVNVRVPFWVLNTVGHLLFMVPKRDHNFDNYPCVAFSEVRV